MKRIIYLSLLSLTAFILFSYSNGIFSADYTGSTGLGQSCAQTGCHTGIGSFGVDTNRLIVRVLNASNTDVDAYTLSQQYNIEIKFKLMGATKVGFQCTNLFYFSSVKAGTVSNTTMPTLVQMYTDGSGREYMSHTAAGNGAAVISGGYAIWKYKWTAPAVASAAISFNCAVNKTNNDNTENGDSIFLSVKTLQLPTGIHDVAEKNNIELFPNPCTDYISLQTDLPLIQKISVIDLYGRQIQSDTSAALNRMDVSSLTTGNYILLLKTTSGVTYSKMFSKM